MKRVFNLIIVDESGSMSLIHQQAFAGMNETLSTVRAMQEKYPETEQHVTLVTFDSDRTKWHYNNVLAKDALNLKWGAYTPSGGTPLYDTIGKAVSMMNAQASQEDNVLVTIITDGEENCSKEWTLKMVKSLIDKLKKAKWTFTLIGTDNLDVEGMAHSMGIDEHLQFCEDAEDTLKMFAREKKARIRYNCSVDACEALPKGSFFDED